MCGLAGALVATSERLQWRVVSASSLCTDMGKHIDLGITSPAYLQGLVVDAVWRWSGSRLGSKFPSLSNGMGGSGAAWRPVT